MTINKPNDIGMREIKFRAWDRVNKNMVDGGFAVYPSGNIKYLKKGLGVDLKLMQYTGLKDKNGKEIYEGDLIQHDAKTPPEKVEWIHRAGNYDAGSVGFNIEPEYDVDLEKLLDYLPNYNVIGNIYENPELLNPNDKEDRP